MDGLRFLYISLVIDLDMIENKMNGRIQVSIYFSSSRSRYDKMRRMDGFRFLYISLVLDLDMIG